jgi:hypothetical protein
MSDCRFGVSFCLVMFLFFVNTFVLYAAPLEIENRQGVVFGKDVLLRGELLSIGQEAPTVEVFYGLADGGTQQTAWASSKSLGTQQTGMVELGIQNLQIGSNYFFRFYAQNSSEQDWSPGSSTFRPVAAYSPEAVDLLEEQMHQNEIDKLRAGGAMPGEIYDYKEHWIERRSYCPEWNQWLAWNDVELYDEPYVFSMTNDFQYRTDTLTNAFRTFWHAWYKADSETLYEISDESGDQGLRDCFWPEDGIDPPEPYHKDLCKVSVLSCQKISVDSVKYYELLFRREHPSAPKSHLLNYLVICFKKDGSNYFNTQDIAARLSYGVLDAGVTNAIFFGIGTYSNVYEILKDSNLPNHFYTIE